MWMCDPGCVGTGGCGLGGEGCGRIGKGGGWVYSRVSRAAVQPFLW